MAGIDPFSEEQARALANLQHHYAVWIDAARALDALPYDLKIKTISGHAYLYEIVDRRGNGTSLGRVDPEKQARFDAYKAEKAALKRRYEASARKLAETGGVCRALRLGELSNEAGALLREADRRGLLGSHVQVVGTNAITAYALEAGGFLRDAPGQTDDFDLSWTGDTPSEGQSLWAFLKAVDPTYTINSERPFQARNKNAYEVEILVAPSRAGGIARRDQPRPVPLPEQEWLLLGTPVDRVVICRDGSPARIVAPDPRYFALQKLWMADQAKRDPLKRGKDRQQGTALLDAIDGAMPQFPMDDAFNDALPGELAPYFADWNAGRSEGSLPSWA